MTESVRAANTAFILVSESSGSPVLLPCYTHDFRGDPITVRSFEPGRTPESSGRIYTDQGAFYPSVCGLRIITEAEYMEKQS